MAISAMVEPPEGSNGINGINKGASHRRSSFDFWMSRSADRGAAPGRYIVRRVR